MNSLLKKHKYNFLKSQNAGLIIFLLVLMLLLSFLSSSFFTANNLTNVIRQVSINGILALGMTFVIITGSIDLSVGSLVAVSGVISGSIIYAHPDAVFTGMIFGILACSALGFINGFLVVKFNIPGFISTLAMLTIARGFALAYADGRPYVLSSKAFKFIGHGYFLKIPIPVWFLIASIIVTGIILSKTKFGRHVYAVGGNALAARASGVRVGAVQLWVFIISGTLAGLSGVILASRIGSGQPAIGTSYEMDAIASCVIGGASLAGGSGSIFGTVMGFIIMGIINNGLNLMNVSSYYQLIVKGAIIALAVILDQAKKKKV